MPNNTIFLVDFGIIFILLLERMIFFRLVIFPINSGKFWNDIQIDRVEMESVEIDKLSYTFRSIYSNAIDFRIVSPIEFCDALDDR